MMTTADTSKSQFNKPKPIDEQFAIEADKGISRFEAMRGRAGTGLTTDEVMRLTRGKI
jgi:hypothetical protein